MLSLKEIKELVDKLTDGELSYLDELIHIEIIKRHVKKILNKEE